MWPLIRSCPPQTGELESNRGDWGFWEAGRTKPWGNFGGGEAFQWGKVPKQKRECFLAAITMSSVLIV